MVYNEALLTQRGADAAMAVELERVARIAKMASTREVSSAAFSGRS
jgi:hypothetical protein